jgi:hypothetical protein
VTDVGSRRWTMQLEWQPRSTALRCPVCFTRGACDTLLQLPVPRDRITHRVSVGRGEREVQVPEDLAELIAERRVIPFVGAGFSSIAGFPQWAELLRHAHENLRIGGDFDKITADCSHDPLKIAEYLLIRSGNNIGPLRHHIADLLRAPIPFFSSAHVDLANLQTPLIYTTNYDDLIERTLRDLDRRVDVLCTPRDLARTRGDCVQVVKFHGDLQYEETLVLTESSYFSRLDFDSPVDLKFRADIIGRSILFIGYGFGDVNVRVIWYKLSRLMRDVPPEDRPPSFIVRVSPNPVLEALDRGVGLTTIVLDPRANARTPDEQAELLERFMLELTLSADPTVDLGVTSVPTFASGRLLKEAEAALRGGTGAHREEHDERLLTAVGRRRLLPMTAAEAAALLEAFANTLGHDRVEEHRKAYALNYAMAYRVDTGTDATPTIGAIDGSTEPVN